MRVGASVGLPLLVMELTGHLHFAVYAAFGALTSLYGHSETVEGRLETQVVVGVALVATLVSAAFYSAAQGPEWLLLSMLALTVVVAGTLGTVMGWVPRGEIFFILVLLVIAGIPLSASEILPAIAAGAGGTAFSVLLTAVEGSTSLAPRSIALGIQRRMRMGSAALGVKRHATIITIACLAVTAAWALARALDIGHPFWAPIAVAALMPALLPADALRRAVHLLAGTLGGVCIAAALFAQEPTPLVLIAIIAACQGGAELFIARNYAIALLFITPLAIGMSNLGRNLPWSSLLIERLAEALLGAVVALVAIFLGSALLASAQRAERKA